MPLTNEEFKDVMTKLLNPELTLEERTELQLSIEKHNGEVVGELELANANVSKLKSNLDDALITNNKLYRETGYFEEQRKDEQPTVVSHNDLLREGDDY